MPIRSSLLIGLIACGTALHGADSKSGDYMVRLKASLWYASSNGAKITQDNAGDVDLDDFGLENSEIAPMVEAGLRAPLLPLVPDVALGFTTWQTEGDADTELETADFWLEAIWGFDLGPLAGVGVGLAAHNTSVRIDISGAEADDDEWIAALAGRAWFKPLDRFDVQARLHLTSYGDTALTDLEAHASWYPTAHIGVIGGLRVLSYELDLDGAIPENALIGPFLGAMAQF
jgi:hypothetical protein